MIKNGRPYTNENRYVDKALITDRDEETIAIVEDWIRRNIRTSENVLYGRTSYGLKHILERDTGVYLTNNEFKDAMLLAGYRPVKSGELNWRYRIYLMREINDNPSPFFRWARKYEKDDTPGGDFVRDMLRDFSFPVLADRNVIERYLGRINACDGAMSAFEKLWRDYARETG